MDAFTIAKKDLKALTNEKTIILAILLLLAISSLSKIIAIGLTILYSPSVQSEIRLGLVGEAPLFESRTPCVKYKSLDSALLALKKGEVDAVLLINENISGTNYIDVFIPKEEIKSIKIIPTLRKILTEYQDRLRAERGIPTLNIKAYNGKEYVEIPEGFSLQFEIIYLVLIPLMAILTAVISSIYVIDVFCEEFEKNTIELLLCCVSIGNFVAGKVLSTFIVSLSLTSFWIAGLIANGIEINVPLTFASSVFFYLLIISLALLTVIKFKRRTEAQFVFSVVMFPVILSLISLNPSPLTLIVKSSLSMVDAATSLSISVSFVLFLVTLILLRRSLQGVFG